MLFSLHNGMFSNLVRGSHSFLDHFFSRNKFEDANSVISSLGFLQYSMSVLDKIELY